MSVNPTTGKTIETYSELQPEDIQQVVDDSHEAFGSWRGTSFDGRARLMRQAADILRRDKASLARLAALEMGKPMAEGVGEVEKCAWVCEYYAEQAEHFLEPELVRTEATRSYVVYEPLGVVLAIMPWNFPFWQVFRFAAPALMAGNTVLLKHASSVPGCALAIERVFREAGFPNDVFNVLLITSDLVREVIYQAKLRAVTLTGSIPAGRVVAGLAGTALKKTVLELGGSDPYLVLEDADLDATVETCVASRLINSGQSCIAAKRFIVVDSVRERFEKGMVETMKEIKVGDPLDLDTRVGPLARTDLRDELHGQVVASIARGARCLLGGERPSGEGAFYPPTVLTDVGRAMPAYDEELFGPVAAIIPVTGEREAIEVANDTQFGLGAAVFTSDVRRGEEIAKSKLEAGCCFVNTFVRSDPRLPFGGIKDSGYGRELGRHSIKEFVNIKTICVA